MVYYCANSVTSSVASSVLLYSSAALPVCAQACSCSSRNAAAGTVLLEQCDSSSSVTRCVPHYCSSGGASCTP
jgi:hypothetical protein